MAIKSKKRIILGGRRSGKSAYSEALIEKLGKKQAIYIASSRIEDDEMGLRVEKHKKRRDNRFWVTYEEDINLISALKKAQRRKLPVLIDCLSIWVSNLMSDGFDVENELLKLEKFLAKFDLDIIFVSLEVGLGIIPMDKIAREYSDNLGIVNQHISSLCDEAYLVVAGNAVKIK